jgi:acetyltransferase
MGMGILHLDRMLHARSVAVIGASERPGSVGNAVMRNLAEAGYEGTIYPVNDHHPMVWGRESLPAVSAIGAAVDLAVIATPIETAPEIVRQCAAAGIGGAVIIAGGGKEAGPSGAQLESRIREAAGRSLRIVGPNCVGLICTHCRLNVTFAHQMPQPGKLAFVSQSGAIGTAILDFACKERIGFSHFISLGSMLDVDFGDVIDYLGNDPAVGSIVMYMEQLSRVRNFMSAARAVARVKPIIALKAGRTPAGARAAASHTGAMASEDAVYDAALQRAGILRVRTFEELFDCAELVAKQPRPQKSGLVIVSNAGGPAVMAADALNDYGIDPVPLGADTLARLNEILPPFWSRANPIDILGHASPQRYLEVIEIVLKAPETDGLLIMLAPQALTEATAVARLLAEHLKGKSIPIVTAWLGGSAVEAGREIFNTAGIPTYHSPERAVRAFMDLFRFSRNIEILQQIPANLPRRISFDRTAAQEIVSRHTEGDLVWLDEVAAKGLLAAYGIPVNLTRQAADADQAVAAAEEMGYPVVLKIDSPQIIHKSDVGGVALNVGTARHVRESFDDLCERVRRQNPAAAIRGVTVQPMLSRADHELILGVKRDRDFGPVILFGQGGITAEIIHDRALALPPLNRLLARRMMEETKIYRILCGYRSLPPADLTLLEEILVRLAQLAADFAQLREIDINPLMISGSHCCAVDARVALAAGDVPAPMHLVISPYPRQLETRLDLAGIGTLCLRPIRPEDAPLMQALFETLSMQTIYYRFFSPLKCLPPGMLARFTQIDYDREIALVAVREAERGEEIIGVARVISTLNPQLSEFAVLVGDRWHGKGIGASLLKRCLSIAKSRGITTVWGSVLAENTHMLALGRKLKFAAKRIPDSSEYELRLDLTMVSEQDLGVC